MTTEQWDRVGYAMIAAFAAYALVTSPLFFSFLVLFGSLGLLIYAMRDPTK